MDITFNVNATNNSQEITGTISFYPLFTEGYPRQVEVSLWNGGPVAMATLEYVGYGSYKYSTTFQEYLADTQVTTKIRVAMDQDQTIFEEKEFTWDAPVNWDGGGGEPGDW